MDIYYLVARLSRESKSLQKRSRFPGLHFELSYIPSRYKCKYLNAPLSVEELCNLHRISKDELETMLKNYHYCEIHDDYFPSSNFTLDTSANVCDDCIMKHIELQKYVRNQALLKAKVLQYRERLIESQLESQASNALGFRRKELKALYPDLLKAKVLQLKITQLIRSKV